MPKSGKAVKRRHSLKVSRKQKRLPKPKMVLSGKYDHSKTLKQNMQLEGIVQRTNPNDKMQTVEEVEGMEIEVLPEKERAQKMAETTQKWCKKAILKHSCYYKKMAMDMELNKNQDTEKQIKKKCQMYMKLHGDPTKRTTKEQAKADDQ